LYLTIFYLLFCCGLLDAFDNESDNYDTYFGEYSILGGWIIYVLFK